MLMEVHIIFIGRKNYYYFTTFYCVLVLKNDRASMYTQGKGNNFANGDQK